MHNIVDPGFAVWFNANKPFFYRERSEFSDTLQVFNSTTALFGGNYYSITCFTFSYKQTMGNNTKIDHEFKIELTGAPLLAAEPSSGMKSGWRCITTSVDEFVNNAEPKTPISYVDYFRQTFLEYMTREIFDKIPQDAVIMMRGNFFWQPEGNRVYEFGEYNDHDEFSFHVVEGHVTNNKSGRRVVTRKSLAFPKRGDIITWEQLRAIFMKRYERLSSKAFAVYESELKEARINSIC